MSHIQSLLGGTDTFGPLSASLLEALQFPFFWPAVANEQIYPNLVAILTAGRAYGFTDPYILPENPVGPLPGNHSDLPRSYPLEAVAGADGAASNGVPLKKVFDDLVATTRDRSPTCMSSILVTFESFELIRDSSRCRVVRCVSYTLSVHSLMHSLTHVVITRSTIPKWPVRSVEALPVFERKNLSNRILVIGNSVSTLLISKVAPEPSDG